MIKKKWQPILLYLVKGYVYGSEVLGLTKVGETTSMVAMATILFIPHEP